MVDLPVELCALKRLETLILNSNKIAHLPTEIGELSSLKTLRLHNNLLTTIPKEMGRLTSLTRLFLEQNSIAEVPAELSVICPNLRECNLCDNPFLELPKQVLEVLRTEECSGLYFSASLPDEVIPGLYIGAVDCSTRLDVLKHRGITHVVRMVNYPKECPFPQVPPRAAHHRKDIKYLPLDVQDLSTQDLLQYFEQACDFINEAIDAGSSALVHW